MSYKIQILVGNYPGMMDRSFDQESEARSVAASLEEEGNITANVVPVPECESGSETHQGVM